jgi:hypothetical protein
LPAGEAGEYNFADLLYSFDTVNPVSEPGTIALIDSGLAGLCSVTFPRALRR